MNNTLKKYPFIGHILFWIGMLFLFILSGRPKDGYAVNVIFGVVIIIPQIIASYLTVYFILPKLLVEKKNIRFGIWMVLSVYLISVFARVIVVHVGEPLIFTQPFEQESILEIFTDLRQLIGNYFPRTYHAVGLFWLFTYMVKSREGIALEKEKSASELKALKSQLNPHFLFNTLNNIYSLSLDNSPKTSESIGKLSEILDYILYRCDSKFVPLSKEVKLLDNYISLEKLRYDDRLKVTFEKDMEQAIEIAPLILLSLVENAFKHGAGEDGGSPVINIFIQSKPNLFTFNIKNTIVEAANDESKDAIGLDNIKKQLDLIYPNQYQLEIEEKKNLFEVTLVLTP